MVAESLVAFRTTPYYGEPPRNLSGLGTASPSYATDDPKGTESFVHWRLFDRAGAAGACERITDGIVFLGQRRPFLRRQEGSLAGMLQPTSGSLTEVHEDPREALIVDLVRCSTEVPTVASVAPMMSASRAAYVARIEQLAADYDRAAVRISQDQAEAFADDAFLEAMELKDVHP